MNQVVALVAIDGATGSFDKLYSYAVPPSLKAAAKEGCRVTVPFGRGNRKRQGIILGLDNAEKNPALKSILSVTDTEPVLNEELTRLCVWMHDRTFCTYFDAVNIMLPAGLKYNLEASYKANPEFVSDSLLSQEELAILEFLRLSGETKEKKLLSAFPSSQEILTALVSKQALLKECDPVRRMRDKTGRYVRLREDTDITAVNLTERQREVVQAVEISGSVSVKELQYFTGASMSVINTLEGKGVFELFCREEFRPSYAAGSSGKRDEIVLTDEQQAAYDGLCGELASGKTSLLYGVTGSGKTQVFLKLTDKVSDEGRGVIVMVPEIALTPQIINIFSSRYGDKIAVFHSAMSIGQRMDEYKRIKSGKATIAIGTRSAVFAPFNDLGLIIIDEEQEHTYKSEKSPRFHARDIARFRVAYNKGLLCLSSATPSLESYSNALVGRYGLYKIPHRYGNAVLPQVSVVDMRKEILDGNRGALSRALTDAIENELSADKQVILLLNRRGHNTYVTCPSCGWVAECPNCSISLTYHSANKRLMCHYCGYSEAVTHKCPDCDSEHVRFMGLGTQKLEEELNLLYPNARVLRLDADSTATRDSYSEKLTAFSNGEYDILLGTQMVAKGLDFPRVTLVGVVGADMAMYSDDYRGFERTFSLLTQVVGRAGRAGGEGRAIIQTVDPDSRVIALATRQDYEAFYNEEILTRKLMTFPPYCDICMVASQSLDRELALSAISEIAENIKAGVSGNYGDVTLTILGPTAASIPKINNKYRFKMLIKCKNSPRFRELLNKSMDIKIKKDLSVTVDINPETVI